MGKRKRASGRGGGGGGRGGSRGGGGGGRGGGKRGPQIRRKRRKTQEDRAFDWEYDRAQREKQQETTSKAEELDDAVLAKLELEAQQDDQPAYSHLLSMLGVAQDSGADEGLVRDKRSSAANHRDHNDDIDDGDDDEDDDDDEDGGYEDDEADDDDDDDDDDDQEARDQRDYERYQRRARASETLDQVLALEEDDDDQHLDGDQDGTHDAGHALAGADDDDDDEEHELDDSELVSNRFRRHYGSELSSSIMQEVDQQAATLHLATSSSSKAGSSITAFSTESLAYPAEALQSLPRDAVVRIQLDPTMVHLKKQLGSITYVPSPLKLELPSDEQPPTEPVTALPTPISIDDFDHDLAKIGVRSRLIQGADTLWTSDASLYSASVVQRKEAEQQQQREEAGQEDDDDDPDELKVAELQHNVELATTMYPIFDSYRDVMYTLVNTGNIFAIRCAYILHCVNHALKSRDMIVNNTGKIRAREKAIADIEAQEELLRKNNKKKGKKDAAATSVNLPKPDRLEIRDQGFTRPKVLILLPMRSSAYEVVKMILALLPPGTSARANTALERFDNEFSVEDDEEVDPAKPADFNWMFRGNTDDCFRCGLHITRKYSQLYADFFQSDIIIASPLGLRTLIDGSKLTKGDCDFLSSIEIVVMEQTDVFLMQNWEHIEFIFSRINEIPGQTRDTDFSRVRPWALNGWAKYYRQTILLSSFVTPEITSFVSRMCVNYEGLLRFVSKDEVGAVHQVVGHAHQRLERVPCTELSLLEDTRFNYFVNEVFPRLRVSMSGRTMIFIPSYFNYVRVRNYFNQEEIPFCSCSDYTSTSDVSRARNLFFHGRRPFMLYTERFHFFHRYKIRGIQHVVFYSLPQNAHFYAEVVNMLQGEASEGSVLVSFTKFDSMEMKRIFGAARTAKLLKDPKPVHLLVGGSQ